MLRITLDSVQNTENVRPSHISPGANLRDKINTHEMSTNKAVDNKGVDNNLIID